MMLHIGSAYAQSALAPVCSVTTLAQSHSAAAVSQNQSDIHLYLVLVTKETSAVVLAQIVTTPHASKQTASVNIILADRLLRMTFHNLSRLMNSNPEALGSKTQSLISMKLWIQQSWMLFFMELLDIGCHRKMSLKMMKKMSMLVLKKVLVGQSGAVAATRRRTPLLSMR